MGETIARGLGAGNAKGRAERVPRRVGATLHVEHIQRAYAEQLPHGQRPEFEMQSSGVGRYHYVNKDGERCDIREVRRQTDTNTTL